MEQKKAKIAELRPIDDIFFEALASKKEVCQEILRTILQDKKLVVLESSVQRDLKNLYGRSVRLDALCTLGDGKKVNIEVQRSNSDDHFRRVRFNESSITVIDSQAGGKFKEVEDLIIVFISEKDFIGEGRTIYHVNKVIRETGTAVDDGLQEIYVNAAIDDGTDIAELMSCFLRKEVNNPKFPELSQQINLIKHSEGGSLEVCDIMEELLEEARKETRQEAIKEGEQKGVLKTLIGLVNDKLLSLEDAAARANIPVEEFAALLNS